MNRVSPASFLSLTELADLLTWEGKPENLGRKLDKAGIEYYRMGRARRYKIEQLEEIERAMICRSGSKKDQIQNSGISQGPTLQADELIKARKRLTKNKQKLSNQGSKKNSSNVVSLENKQPLPSPPR